MEKIKGCVEKIIYRNPENGYTVLSLENNGDETTCVGVFQLLDEGESVEFTGEYVLHPSYGEQFKVHSYDSILPDDLYSIEKYLSSGAIRGIGKATAKRIIAKFGEDTHKIIDEQPERLSEIKGISLKKAQEISQQVEEKKEMREAMIFLGKYGISNGLAVKIYIQYGQEVYSIIRENPYRLADDITGIGFKKADEIAFNAGFRRDSEFRIESCIIYVLMCQANEGNAYMPQDKLEEEVLNTLAPNVVDGVPEIKREDVAQCILNLAVESRVKVLNQESERQVFYSLYYHTELSIAGMLKEINLSAKVAEQAIENRISKVEENSNIKLDELQKAAIKAAVNSGILVITGGPGTGKTTTINSIIKYFNEDDKEIILAAPTGRAAKKMAEATGYEAKTIHRLLELSGEPEDSSPGSNFGRNEDNPLDADVIIIDEMSMVDMFLMCALLKAIRPGTRLILVGDVDQLPSVGCGNVLRDIIESEKINTVKLTKIFRQDKDSDIITNAHKINNGEDIELKPNSKDFIFIKRDNANLMLGTILALLRDKLPKYVNADRRDIEVLAPAKKGILGVENINKFLQQQLNPPARRKRELPVGSYVFRVGDKVMHIKNDYELEWEMRFDDGYVYDRGTGVFNGDIGVITSISEHAQIAEVFFDDGRYVLYEYSRLEELVLAYAVTIHKSQGSEYPAVILPLLSGPPQLMNRNILYTAVTRAKQCVCVVGSEEAVLGMIHNERQQLRYSGLRDRILEIF